MKEKAKSELSIRGDLDQQLANAVYELDMLDQHEVPEHKWVMVRSIIDSCRTYEAKGGESEFRASINAMTYEQQKSLKEAIELL